MPKRACCGLNKAGQPCGSPPLKDADYCYTHSEDVPVSERFGTVQQATTAGQLGGRPRRPREIELIQEVADEYKDQMRAVLVDGLNAQRAVVVGNGPTAYVEMVPDGPHRLSTFREIMDRLHGRPTQSVENSTPAVNVNFNLVTDDDLRTRAADLRRGLAAARRPIEPSGLDACD